MPGLTQDLRYAFRLLARAPGFTTVVVATLALGIGANTAIFSVVHALLLRPLPYREPDRLVMVWQDLSAAGGPAREWTTPGNFVDLASARDTFATVTAVLGWQPTLTGLGNAEPLIGEQVSREYFDVTGIPPARGRAFTAADDSPGAARVAIISHGLWARRFGSDPAVLGRQVMLGGESHQIVGIMPPTFRPVVAPDAELWRPGRLNRAAPARGMVILRTIARLAPGLGVEQARAAAATLSRRLERTYPDSNQHVALTLEPLRDHLVGNIRASLLVLLTAVGFVLLIACANVANLLLARAAGRSREMSVRLALGARRSRVVRQLLTESLVLAAMGGLLGLLVGVWGVDALGAVMPPGLPRLDDARLEPRVLAFAAALSVATGLLFGLAPAIQASRGTLGAALKDGARGTAGRGGRRARRALVIAEIAIALVLLVGSGLLLRTFLRLQAADLGFEPAGVLVGTVVPPRPAYPNREALQALYDRLLAGVTAIPGVQQAALTSILPLGGDNDTDVEIEGMPAVPGAATTTWYRLVSAGYLDAMGIPLRRGRGFAPGEAPPGVIVNERAARRFWPGQDAIGRRVRTGGANTPWSTVIGIAGDVSMRGARGDARVEMYFPYWQVVEPGTNVVLKTLGAPEGLAAGVRAAVKAIDPNLPVSNLAPMTRLVESSIELPRFLAILAATFAALALVLSAIGIYGVMSYSVAQRTAEIGVRMALGADRRSVFALVVRDGLLLAAAGIAIGAVAARWLGSGLGTLLYAVAPGDPTTFVITAAGLLAVALAAVVLPARRATRVDPLTALRME